jgi:hypothetical protein
MLPALAPMGQLSYTATTGRSGAVPERAIVPPNKEFAAR